MSNLSLELFEDAGRQNGQLYWYAHELMDLLGYQSWGSFQSVITRAMGACTRLGLDPTESFAAETVIEDGKPRKTYRLSRFACLLVSMTADSKKPEVAQFKALLASIADALIDAQIGSQDLGRLETREDLKLAEKQMSAAAQGAGLQNQEFGIFKDAGFRGMYNMSLKDLSRSKGLTTTGRKTLYDFMGMEELAGNLFRVTQTTARIRARDVRGLRQLSDTANEVGREVRSMMIQNSGVRPESLPLEEDISKVGSRLKKVDREMRKLGGPKGKKLKGPRKGRE